MIITYRTYHRPICLHTHGHFQVRSQSHWLSKHKISGWKIWLLQVWKMWKAVAQFLSRHCRLSICQHLSIIQWLAQHLVTRSQKYTNTRLTRLELGKKWKCEVSFRPMRSFARVGNPRQHPGASNLLHRINMTTGDDNRWLVSFLMKSSLCNSVNDAWHWGSSNPPDHKASASHITLIYPTCEDRNSEDM
jgi:hypothetical protein